MGNEELLLQQGTRTKILNCVSSLWRHFSSSRFSIF